jgi:hypothetical protein
MFVLSVIGVLITFANTVDPDETRLVGDDKYDSVPADPESVLLGPTGQLDDAASSRIGREASDGFDHAFAIPYGKPIEIRLRSWRRFYSVRQCPGSSCNPLSS